VKTSGRHHFSALAAAACAGTLTIAGLAVTASAQTAGRAELSGTHPAWAVPAREVASAGTGSPVTAQVYLTGRDPAGLAAYATSVSDPGSRSYRRFLTPAAERQRFGPTTAQVSAVTGWLTGAGLRVTAVTQHYVAVTGPVAAAQAAFAVRLGTFRGPGGAVAMAPEQAVSVPAALRAAVLGVTGLDTATAVMHPAAAGPPPAFYRAGPCSRYWGQHVATTKPTAYGKHVPWALCGYTPYQLRKAYGVGSAATGRGVTVAIVDAYDSPTMPADANSYAAAVGDQGLRAGQYQQLLPTSFDDQNQCGAPGWNEEESLDIEAVHAMAPDADIDYVAASDCTFQALLDALASIVDYHAADVVTDSWTGQEQGLGSSLTAVADQIFEQGASEGIGFDFASGDCGYNNPATACGAADGSSEIQADYPTSSPWVTAVGGTSLAIGKNANYEWETAWGDLVVPQAGRAWQQAPAGPYPAAFAYGTGGGTSMLYPQPSYQAGVVPLALATRLPSGRVVATPQREVPDVALDADPSTGFLFGETVRLRGGKDGFFLSRIGGTSLASPLFAGIEADAAQLTSGHQLGFVNPALYRLAGTPAFRDVTGSPLGRGVRIAMARNDWANTATGTGKLRTSLYTLGLDGEGAAALTAAKGYDDATGLGSPAPAFIRDLAATP
jgi:subtilase family serine protease